MQGKRQLATVLVFAMMLCACLPIRCVASCCAAVPNGCLMRAASMAKSAHQTSPQTIAAAIDSDCEHASSNGGTQVVAAGAGSTGEHRAGPSLCKPVLHERPTAQAAKIQPATWLPSLTASLTDAPDLRSTPPRVPKALDPFDCRTRTDIEVFGRLAPRTATFHPRDHTRPHIR